MRENLKKYCSIVIENTLISEGSLSTEGVLAIICSNSFSHCKVDQKNVAISQIQPCTITNTLDAFNK